MAAATGSNKARADFIVVVVVVVVVDRRGHVRHAARRSPSDCGGTYAMSSRRFISSHIKLHMFGTLRRGRDAKKNAGAQ